MKIRAVSKKQTVIPNIEFEDGTKNRDLKPSEQVVCVVNLASVDEKAEYLAGYSVTTEDGGTREHRNYSFSKAIRSHVVEVSGLDIEDKDGKIINLKNGADLDNWSHIELIDVLMVELFFIITGIRDNEEDTMPEGE